MSSEQQTHYELPLHVPHVHAHHDHRVLHVPHARHAHRVHHVPHVRHARHDHAHRRGHHLD